MFTGIIEELGEVVGLKSNEGNLDLTISSKLSQNLKIDQSIAHNGVCLTVVDVANGTHTVTAIQETLQLTNLNELELGSRVNLERCVQLNDRLDGHLVQGHVDGMGQCDKIVTEEGSWRFYVSIDKKFAPLLISKGSVTINGVSLTVIEPSTIGFHVAIIPYTYENTTFGTLVEGDAVNLEFDVIGKYLQRHIDLNGI